MIGELAEGVCLEIGDEVGRIGCIVIWGAFLLATFSWFANVVTVMVFCNYGVFCDNLIFDDDVHRSRTFFLKSRHKLGHLVAGKDPLLHRDQPVPSFVISSMVMML